MIRDNRLVLIVQGILLAGITARSHASSLICQLKPTANPTEIARVYKIKYLAQAPGAPFFLFDIQKNQVDAVEQKMSKDPQIVWSDLDGDQTLSEPGTTAHGATIPVVADRQAVFEENKGLLSQINWSPKLASESLNRVKVGILDTGISPNAKELLGQVVYSANQLTRTGNANDLPDPAYSLTEPQNYGAGHGTMVAGLIAEIAPNADLVIEKVADSSGHGTNWSVICGLTDVVSQKASVCNISLGARGEIPAFEQVFAWARAKGLTVVAPIGNNGKNLALSPSNLDGVICVSGVDQNSVRASFSNYNYRADIAAPATGVKSYYWDGNLAIWSGTSFSAPLVTGAISLAIGCGNYLSTTDWEDALRITGTSIDVLNPKFKGRLGKLLSVGALVHSNRTTKRP